MARVRFLSYDAMPEKVREAWDALVEALADLQEEERARRVGWDDPERHRVDVATERYYRALRGHGIRAAHGVLLMRDGRRLDSQVEEFARIRYG